MDPLSTIGDEFDITLLFIISGLNRHKIRKSGPRDPRDQSAGLKYLNVLDNHSLPEGILSDLFGLKYFR